MTDRYNPLVHEVNATVRMGAHPDGGYVLASDYDLLVTEHENTEAELARSEKECDDADFMEARIATLESELATMTGAYLRVEGERDAQQQLNRNWLKENAPGGWIDNQRIRIGVLEAAGEALAEALNGMCEADDMRPSDEICKAIDDWVALTSPVAAPVYTGSITDSIDVPQAEPGTEP